MGTSTRYADSVPRPKYTPPSDAVEAEIQEAADLYGQRQELDARLRGRLKDLADRRDVPISYLAERLGLGEQRKKVYRLIGRSMP